MKTEVAPVNLLLSETLTIGPKNLLNKCLKIEIFILSISASKNIVLNPPKNHNISALEK